LCNRFAERSELHVVREAAPTVDLDHGKPLAVLGLERLVARDVHLPQPEAQLDLKRPDLGQRPLAEMAALRVVDDDVGGYG
jgi:hypothetical protein